MSSSSSGKKKKTMEYYWEKNTSYPVKRGTCEFCGSTDKLKLSFDQMRYICLNAGPCLLRWRKSF